MYQNTDPDPREIAELLTDSPPRIYSPLFDRDDFAASIMVVLVVFAAIAVFG
jgi:hypothetical protein